MAARDTPVRRTLPVAIALVVAALMAVLLPSASAGAAAPTANMVVAWGYDVAQQTDVPPGLSNVVAIAAGGSHTLALKRDGTVVAWGSNDSGQASVPLGLSGVKALGAGEHYSVALKTNGTVVAWGTNAEGELDVPAGLTGVQAISAGGRHVLALRNDGTVVAWGANGSGQSTPPAGLANVIAVAAGGDHSLALTSDGTIVAWGADDGGQTTVPSAATNVVAIAASVDHSLALKSDGTVVAWGSNGNGESTVPGGLANVKAIAAGAFHSVALQQDGTIVVWGMGYLGQQAVPPGLTGITSVVAGGAHNVVIAAATPAPVAVVVGNATTLAPGDNALVQHLTNQAYAVQVVDDDSLTTVGAQTTLLGAKAVIVSATVTGTLPAFSSFLSALARPVIVMDPDAAAAMSIAYAGKNGQLAGQTQTRLWRSDRLSAGLSLKSYAVTASAAPMIWFTPVPSATVIATQPSSNKVEIFSVDAGAPLLNGIAPARRIGWFLAPPTASTTNATGWRLFNAAVDAAVGG